MPIAIVFLSEPIMKKIKIDTAFDVYDTLDELATPIQNLLQKASEAREKAYAPLL